MECPLLFVQPNNLGLRHASLGGGVDIFIPVMGWVGGTFIATYSHFHASSTLPCASVLMLLPAP